MFSATYSQDIESFWIGAASLAAIFAAIAIGLSPRGSRHRFAVFYVLAWLLLTLGQVARGASPARFYIWSGLAEWSGILLVTSIVGWFTRRRRLALRPESAVDRRWFLIVQALCMGAVAVLVGWIATDVAFDGMGTGLALFGLSGRACACPSALMLVGASIVMSWQSTGRWRAAWQFAAMAMGILFTTSVGWARIDVTDVSMWTERRTSLMISTAMMTLMTWVGLPRVLPKTGDWIHRGRQTAPIFAISALGLMVATLLQKIVFGS